MIIITGTQCSGKSTAAKYLSDKHNLDVDVYWNHINRVFNSTDFKNVLSELLSKKQIVECGLKEAFCAQLLEIPNYMILMQSPRKIKYKRMSERKKISKRKSILLFEREWNDLENIENMLIPNITIQNIDIKSTYSMLDKIDVRLITEYMPRQ
jgi:cytidylate kinase